MTDMFERLSAPFAPHQVSWRVGTSNKKKRQRETGDNNAKATKGQVLAYIDARDVMDRLDAVCGPDGWQNRYPHADKKTICEIGIRAPDGEWVWKSDGAGDSDIEAEKGALSDAFKRSAVRWGIGRYLYHLPTPWVDLDEREQIPEGERRKLEALLNRDAKTKPAQAPTETRVEASAAVQAALMAISMCRDMTAHTKWQVDNEAALAKLSDAEANVIIRAWKAKGVELKPRAVA